MNQHCSTLQWSLHCLCQKKEHDRIKTHKKINELKENIFPLFTSIFLLLW
jgi:hypothetical protein